MWEFNTSGWPWSSFSASQFVTTFQRAASAFYAVPGADFRIVWNENGAPSVPAAYFPGAAYVNAIGIDQYDFIGYAANMQAAISFAQQKGLPLQVDEWGVNGQDDPTYVTTMASDILNDHISLEVYFDNANSVIQDYPSALTAYRAAFG